MYSLKLYVGIRISDLMALASNSPILRNQVQVVVGSIENLLCELQGVAADLRVVVNQIDDVTSRIEQTQYCNGTMASLGIDQRRPNNQKPVS